MNLGAEGYGEASQFDLLVEVIGILRQADSRPGLVAKVRIENPDNGPIQLCAIEARIDGRSYVAEQTVGPGRRRVSYQPDTGTASIDIHGEASISRDKQWQIPVAAPELAMFRPLDLPMWGGDEDTHRLVGVARTEEGYLLEVAMIDQDGRLAQPQQMVIGKRRGIVESMTWNYRRYSVTECEVSGIWG